MAIKTSRAEGVAEVRIDDEKCSGCGLCVKVCKGAPLIMREGKPFVDQTRLFGCIACGKCVVVCPEDAITVEGRDLFAADVLPIAPREQRASYAQLHNLMLARRSTREFSSRPVERELVDQIIEAAASAPMGLPPSDVSALVLHGRGRVRELRDAMMVDLKKIKPFVTRTSLSLMRPFMKREEFESFDTFIVPTMDTFLQMEAEGADWWLYDAPLAVYFYCSPYSDPADPFIAATYAMLAGEALGLGSIMIGTAGYFFKYSRRLRQQFNIPHNAQQGLMVLFGHPAVKYRKAIRRRLARVEVLGEG
ncbi:nitroreductase [Ornatilinea apprima]|uniref:Nitroreductase n=1 Tax=Ornatilinea apprima TaxID=1134406 RepID=A0A0P6XL74_9CHLR|nr:nitroreductase family protein [Ornatilinea apprima]KPL76971.1 nitroreductase [Ornatilinea apprima]